jgi:hypothetical protein
MITHYLPDFVQGGLVSSTVLAVLAVSGTVSELRAQESFPRGVGGCWAVRLGSWDPPMSIGADTVYSTPPLRIEVQEAKGTEAFESRGWRVRPAPGTKPSVHRFAYLMPLTADSVRIAWTTGFSGVTMRLAMRVDTLTGRAETFWDFGRPTQSADAVLTRIACR